MSDYPNADSLQGLLNRLPKEDNRMILMITAKLSARNTQKVMKFNNLFRFTSLYSK